MLGRYLFVSPSTKENSTGEMDDISLVKSEPNADGTAYDEETVGMNSDTEDEDCVDIINEENLFKFPSEQTSKLSYPVGCPVWFKRHRHNDREVYSYGIIISVHMDLTSSTRKIYYRIKEKTNGGSHGSNTRHNQVNILEICTTKEPKLANLAACPLGAGSPMGTYGKPPLRTCRI